MQPNDELDPIKLALSRQLRADFAADLLRFCAKWQDNMAEMGLARECGVIMSVPLMDATIGHVVSMEILQARRGILSGPLLEYGRAQVDKAWRNKDEIMKEIGKDLMEALEKLQKR